MGPVSWTYPSEIFPMRVRAKAVSVATGSFLQFSLEKPFYLNSRTMPATNWLFNFALAWAVPPGLSNIAYKTYFIFGAFNFAAFLHILFCFPETAGRTLEEVEAVFEDGRAPWWAAWRVKRDVGKKTLQEAVKEKQHVVSSNIVMLATTYQWLTICTHNRRKSSNTMLTRRFQFKTLAIAIFVLVFLAE